MKQSPIKSYGITSAKEIDRKDEKGTTSIGSIFLR